MSVRDHRTKAAALTWDAAATTATRATRKPWRERFARKLKRRAKAARKKGDDLR